MMHIPSFNEIDQLCHSAHRVNRHAVEDFILSLDLTRSPRHWVEVLNKDAALFRWGRGTVTAIRQGIKLAYGGRC